MKLFVGNTDISWFRFLRDHNASEANFWRPSSQNRNFSAIDSGELFFFRLKQPVSKIVGHGIYRSHELLPLSVAWDWCREGNGCSSEAELIRMIAPHRTFADIREAHSWQIGCTILSDLVFYPEYHWLDMPMAAGIVQGKSVDVFSAEGSRIWLHMQQVTKERDIPVAAEATEFTPLSIDELATYQSTNTKARPSRGSFSALVMRAYDWRCCVTSEHTLPVLDAAHIQSYINRHSDHIGNGIPLRKDVHTLFDRGYVGIDASYKFLVSRRLETEWHNGKIYYELEGKQIHLPSSAAQYPSKQALAWHLDNVFLG